MRAIKYYNPDKDEYIFDIGITPDDLENPLLDHWDRRLIEECKNSESIADMLLMLETIARRGEERDAK